jgi:hypothetical protein
MSWPGSPDPGVSTRPAAVVDPPAAEGVDAQTKAEAAPEPSSLDTENEPGGEFMEEPVEQRRSGEPDTRQGVGLELQCHRGILPS